MGQAMLVAHHFIMGTALPVDIGVSITDLQGMRSIGVSKWLDQDARVLDTISQVDHQK